jgi:hypothetical protein
MTAIAMPRSVIFGECPSETRSDAGECRAAIRTDDEGVVAGISRIARASARASRYALEADARSIDWRRQLENRSGLDQVRQHGPGGQTLVL